MKLVLEVSDDGRVGPRAEGWRISWSNDHLKYEVTKVRRFVFRSVVVGKL